MSETAFVIWAWQGGGSSGFLRWLTPWTAQWLPFVVLVVVGGLLAARRRPWQWLIPVLASATLSRVAITESIRFFWNRPRPFEQLPITPLIAHEGGHAFPSGHAAFFFAVGFSLWPISRPAASVMIIAAALNGLARIAAGVHWPTDIAGGASVALFSAALSIRAFSMRRRFVVS